MPTASPPKERTLVFLIGAVQFVNVLDFVMVTPLGPWLSGAMHFPQSEIGLLVASYTAAAAVAGVTGAFFLERFDRRRALFVAMLGLVTGTALCGFAGSVVTLMIARVVAGLFGGPATSLALSIVADAVPVERRGKALGAVMGAFSLATVLGVPAGVRLAVLGGARLPFFAVAGLGLVISVAAVALLPPMTEHRAHVSESPWTELEALLEKRDVRLSYTMTAVTMFAGFIIIPNMPAYLTLNLGYPTHALDRLYLLGGVLSFIVLRVMGRAVDRYSSFRVGTLGSALYLGMLLLGFVWPPAQLPVIVFFLGFYFALGTRNVSYSTLTSKVPAPDERARFMSMQSAVQHLASAVGAGLSSRLITVDAVSGVLLGAPRLAAVAGLFTVALPPLLYTVEKRVNARERASEGSAGPGSHAGTPAGTEHG